MRHTETACLKGSGTMADFSSGVAGYIKGTCLVEVFFPIDSKGRADVRCEQCQYYGRSSKTCQLNKQVLHYPATHIGAYCPLNIEGEVEE